MKVKKKKKRYSLYQISVPFLYPNIPIPHIEKKFSLKSKKCIILILFVTFNSMGRTNDRRWKEVKFLSLFFVFLFPLNSFCFVF